MPSKRSWMLGSILSFLGFEIGCSPSTILNTATKMRMVQGEQGQHANHSAGKCSKVVVVIWKEGIANLGKRLAYHSQSWWRRYRWAPASQLMVLEEGTAACDTSDCWIWIKSTPWLQRMLWTIVVSAYHLPHIPSPSKAILKDACRTAPGHHALFASFAILSKNETTRLSADVWLQVEPSGLNLGGCKPDLSTFVGYSQEDGRSNLCQETLDWPAQKQDLTPHPIYLYTTIVSISLFVPFIIEICRPFTKSWWQYGSFSSNLWLTSAEQEDDREKGDVQMAG